MAGVALTGLGDALGCGWVATGRRTLCVAGVALGDMDLHFAWQAWRLRHWVGTGAYKLWMLAALYHSNCGFMLR